MNANSQFGYYREVDLPDGLVGQVRELRPEDKPLLAKLFQELSPETRYRRFLHSIDRLPPALLRRLVDDVDGQNHRALVLFVPAGDGMEPVAIARLIRYSKTSHEADVSIVVRDAWQGRGYGRILLPLVVEERPPAVSEILTTVLQSNKASLALLSKLGPMEVESSGPTMDVRVSLTQV